MADGALAPTPYENEQMVLGRSGVRLILDNVKTATKSWTADGTLFLSNMRLVFVALKPDESSGLVSFSFPLAHLSDDTKFVQPIFKCNHLAGVVKAEAAAAASATDGTSPAPSPPSTDPESHAFKLEFREGGVGTFLPLFLRFLEYLRAVRRKAETGSAAWTPPVEPEPTPAPSSATTPQATPPQPAWPTAAPPINTSEVAIVDPSDPSRIFLTSPVSESAGQAPFGGAGSGGSEKK